MIVSLKWLRFLASGCLLILVALAAVNYKTSVYLIYQAEGQLSLLFGTQDLEEFVQRQRAKLTEEEKENLLLVEKIKAYSVDSLSYKPTKNFTRIYDQKGEPVLWVLTACEPYALRPYQWSFPLIGKVSYKGFFRKELAMKEYIHLAASGYDADIRSVSAWSTLGWLNDPLLSSMLRRSKGSLCNLLFHELFHATYYAESSVDFNENIASFVAHKATQLFLVNDTAALKEYNRNYRDGRIFNNYMLRSIERLKVFYLTLEKKPDRHTLKLKYIAGLADSIDWLPLQDKTKYMSRKKNMLGSGNAYLIDFVQYDSMQDSLEKVFNKIYKGDLEKMVQDLKLN